MADITVPSIVLAPPALVASLYLGTTYTGQLAITPPIKVRVVEDFLTGLFGKGIGRIKGTVKEAGSPDRPVFRLVRLIRQKDGLKIREVWSDPVTGAYEFQYIDELQLYTVLSYDHTGNYNAVVKASIIPELMP